MRFLAVSSGGQKATARMVVFSIRFSAIVGKADRRAQDITEAAPPGGWHPCIVAIPRPAAMSTASGVPTATSHPTRWGFRSASESDKGGHVMGREQIETEIRTMKQLLLQTDYVALKCAEDETMKVEYADVLVQRNTWRARINELEEMMEQLDV